MSPGGLEGKHTMVLSIISQLIRSPRKRTGKGAMTGYLWLVSSMFNFVQDTRVDVFRQALNRQSRDPATLRECDVLGRQASHTCCSGISVQS